MNPRVDAIAHLLEQVRERQPVVHAMTNWVTGSDVANVLHTMGARPILAVALEEVTDITSNADALVLNLGTPTPQRVEAMLKAGHRANTLGRPVIFDPVGVGASRFRIDATRHILSELRLTIIKGNRAEIGMLTGTGGQLRGVDAATGPEDLRIAGEVLSRQTKAVVIISGQHDLVVDGEKAVVVENGHPLMGQVTGTGCMLSALIAAFAAVEDKPMVAAIGAVACFGLAGERAGHRARGPGTFKAELLDSLFALTPDDVRSGVRINPFDSPV